MILDTMNKYEVMRAVRKDFDEDVLVYYNKVLRPQIQHKTMERARRLRSTISLGWKEYTSKNLITYWILLRGNADGDAPLFVAEFNWRKRLGKTQTIYATLHPNQTVSVYTQHSLERYAERVLNNMSVPTKEVLTKYILKSQKHSFQVVLSSPTHQFSRYHSLAEALFLGDYVDGGSKEETFCWYNTCISLEQAGRSQFRIFNCLSRLQNFMIDYDFNPVKEPRLIKNRFVTQQDQSRFIEFMTTMYLLYKLHLNYGFSFTNQFRDEILSDMKLIENELYPYGINVSLISPYDSRVGVAYPNELDYKE